MGEVCLCETIVRPAFNPDHLAHLFRLDHIFNAFDHADFFTPIQVRDLGDYVPNLLPFLSLPPGFRFLTDTRGHHKAWFDGSLLDV